MTQSESERLARFLAHSGIASRRHAEELIAAGRVQVNGIVVTSQGTRIHPERDEVRVDGTVVQQATEHVYVLLHKPVGYVCTMHDPQRRPTVLDLLPAEWCRAALPRPPWRPCTEASSSPKATGEPPRVTTPPPLPR